MTEQNMYSTYSCSLLAFPSIVYVLIQPCLSSGTAIGKLGTGLMPELPVNFKGAANIYIRANIRFWPVKGRSDCLLLCRSDCLLLYAVSEHHVRSTMRRLLLEPAEITGMFVHTTHSKDSSMPAITNLSLLITNY